MKELQKLRRIFHNNLRGFTLIELLLGILIVTIITGAGVANFRRLNNIKQVEDAAKQVEQAIRKAQKQATAGVKPAGWCDGPTDTLVGYTIGLGTPTANQYEMSANCSDGSVDAQVKNLRENVVVDSSVNVVFDLLGRANGDRTVCVRDSKSRYFYEVVINVGGSVSFEKTTSC